MASSAESAKRTKIIWNDICQLKSMRPKSTAPVKFILDQSPFKGGDDDEDDTPSLPSDEAIILGRLLPNKPPFDQCSLPVKIVLAGDYPRIPPKIFMLKDTFHPNVSKTGELCIPLTEQGGKGTFKPGVALKDVIVEATATIDKPNPNFIQHTEAAFLYENDRPEFDRIAKVLIQKNFYPRS